MGIIITFFKMAHVDVASLSKTERDELCCTYAALLLHDGELEITADKLTKVIKASGNSVESYWPGLFAKALQGQDVAKLLANVSAGAPAASGAPAAGGAAAAEKEPEKEAEPEEEVDMDMGGMFGGDDDDY